MAQTEQMAAQREYMQFAAAQRTVVTHAMALAQEAGAALRGFKLDLPILKVQLLVWISIELYYIGG